MMLENAHVINRNIEQDQQTGKSKGHEILFQLVPMITLHGNTLNIPRKRQIVKVKQ